MVRHRAAREAYSDLFDSIAEMRDQGVSYQRIADRLNHFGHNTHRGSKWSAMSVKRVPDRATEQRILVE